MPAADRVVRPAVRDRSVREHADHRLAEHGPRLRGRAQHHAPLRRPAVRGLGAGVHRPFSAASPGPSYDDTLWRQTRESLLKMERDPARGAAHPAEHVPAGAPGIRRLPGRRVEPARRGDRRRHLRHHPDHRAGGRAGPIAWSYCSPTRPATASARPSRDAGASMLRMGVRQDHDLLRIAKMMNEQLHADLPGGRFITAWIGALDVARRTLSWVSAGQGPDPSLRRRTR